MKGKYTLPPGHTCGELVGIVKDQVQQLVEALQGPVDYSAKCTRQYLPFNCTFLLAGELGVDLDAQVLVQVQDGLLGRPLILVPGHDRRCLALAQTKGIKKYTSAIMYETLIIYPTRGGYRRDLRRQSRGSSGCPVAGRGTGRRWPRRSRIWGISACWSGERLGPTPGRRHSVWFLYKG